MSLKCETPADVLKAIKDNDVKYVDLRFTDPRGKWQHTAQDVATVDEDRLQGRFHVRRLVDCGLEGHQRVRHGPDPRPVLRR